MKIFDFLKRKPKEEYLSPIVEDEALTNFLSQKNFNTKRILHIGNRFYAAINKNYTKLVIIENFDIHNPDYCSYQEIAPSLISAIEKSGSTLKIYYVKKGDKNVLEISPFTKEQCSFFHDIYKTAALRKIEEKFQDKNFTISSASDFEINFLWAYNPKTNTFAYYKTTARQFFNKLNLKKEEFLIDVEYDYFELGISGQKQQLDIYEHGFIKQLFENLYQTIKQSTKIVSKLGIFYDEYTNIVYLSNNSSVIQSVKLDEMREVYYKDNKICFIPVENKKETVFRADEEFIKEFDNFIISRNLRKISINFDYKTDKIINTASNTKFIIDYARKRLVYCANLNKLSQFSFISIAFGEIAEAYSRKNRNRNFARIITTNNDVVDITCKKTEIAQYIAAQIKIILSEKR